MGITPKRNDIINKILPAQTLLTRTVVKINKEKNIVTINLEYGDKILAIYWYESAKINLKCISIMEGLVAAKFATETLTNIINKTNYPILEGYDTLLSRYGMADVKLINSSIWPQNFSNYDCNILLFSGGVDSSHLLFTRLKGNCNLVSFYHGQSNYRSGIHSEEKASFLVPDIVRDFFNLSIPQTKLNCRWKCRIKRVWAKAYRNLMFITQAFSSNPSNIYIGTSIDDRLHDSFPDFLEEFSKITGIPIIAPNLNTGRDKIMEDIINLSLTEVPYLYASTCSCQLQRYTGKKFLNEGSCHSCILRLPAVTVGGDPRFSNFNRELKLVPLYLENALDSSKFYQRKPSQRILKTFFEDLSDNPRAFKCFTQTLKFIEQEWPAYELTKILTPEQLSLVT